MKHFLFIVFFVSYSSYSQYKIKPFIEVGYGKNLIEGFYLSNVLHFGVGAKLTQHFYLQLNFVQVQGIREFLYNTDYYKSRILSVSSSYRLFKEKKTISPIVKLEIGAETWSNARGEFVWFGGSSLEIVDHYDEVSDIYNKGVLYSKLYLQADVNLSCFNLLVGVGYSYYRFDVDYLKPVYTGNNLVGYSIDHNGYKSRFGFSLEASLRYTLNFGKKDKNIH